MNNKLNLASKPFTNRSLPWTITAVVLLVSLVAFILIIRATGRANTETAALQSEIRKLRQEEEGLRKQAGEVKESLTADQQSSLKAAHELVDRKEFSWTRLFNDLEAALPGTVRVTRITVREVAARGEQTVAELELAVVANAASTVTNMIADMDRAGVFQAELRSQNLQKGRGEKGTEFELLVIYRPRAGAPLGETLSSNLALAENTPSSNGGSK